MLVKAEALIQLLDGIRADLKEDVVEQLKSSFQPIGFNTLDNKDITNIAYLIKINKEDLKKQYFNLNEIAKIFLPSLAKIPNFSKSIEGIEDEKIKETLTPLNDNYEALFKLIAPAEQNLTQNNLAKLNTLIANNKDNFSYVLANDQKAIEDIILGVNDGCLANIATQLNNQALLYAIGNLKDISEEKKYSLLAFYNAVMEKVIIPLINKGGDQLGASSSANFLVDNLNKQLLKEAYLPLTALYKLLEYSPGEFVKIIGQNKARNICFSCILPFFSKHLFQINYN